MNAWDRHHVEPASVDDAILHARIAETILWCESLGSIAACRWTRLPLDWRHEDPDELVCNIGRDRQAAAGTCRPRSPFPIPGRFLLHFPDENLCDGIAEYASDGFFDVFNVPPIDTWVSWFIERGRRAVERPYLLCYAPSWALRSADAGIDVNPEACIMWLDQSDVALRRRVEAFAHARR
jgi:hypothetical protein